mmetsp:Transcript_8360/g.20764  ORF Transcript_8360/g.20764 Transcript_8360/m.20764 type:complete len:309 (-) Transcript_8360:220-1146(-)
MQVCIVTSRNRYLQCLELHQGVVHGGRRGQVAKVRAAAKVGGGIRGSVGGGVRAWIPLRISRPVCRRHVSGCFSQRSSGRFSVGGGGNKVITRRQGRVGCRRRPCVRRICSRRICSRRICSRRICNRRPCVRRFCSRRICSGCFNLRRGCPYRLRRLRRHRRHCRVCVLSLDLFRLGPRRRRNRLHCRCCRSSAFRTLCNRLSALNYAFFSERFLLGEKGPNVRLRQLPLHGSARQPQQIVQGGGRGREGRRPRGWHGDPRKISAGDADVPLDAAHLHAHVLLLPCGEAVGGDVQSHPRAAQHQRPRI